MAKKPKKKANKYRVAKVGWENENHLKSVILLSRKERTELGVDVQAVVKVKKGRKTVLAFVWQQFRELLGQDKICTVNKILQKELKLKLNDKVEISKEVTETEHKEFVGENAPLFFG